MQHLVMVTDLFLMNPYSYIIKRRLSSIDLFLFYHLYFSTVFFSLYRLDLDQDPTPGTASVMRIDHVSDEILVAESGKVAILVDLLDNLREEGHRCLVFSQSRKMLDIIERVLHHKVYNTYLLDFVGFYKVHLNF